MLTTKGDASTVTVATFALAFLTLGIWMVLDPAGFQAAVGSFGTINEHLIRDLATFNLALGAVLTVAAVRPTWRLPVVWFANVQNALHLLNHVADADQAEPLWMGMANVWALLAIGIVLAALLAVVSRRPRPGSPAQPVGRRQGTGG
ncbi:MAG TPA: hypothetical protein VF635_14910 [Propionibacteriaceae bacterium]|jgi:hypothetical protein